MAAKVAEYAVPTTPSVRELVVTERAGFIVIVSAFVAVKDPLATLKVTDLLPVVVGVPVIAPELLRLRPVGRVDPDFRDHV